MNDTIAILDFGSQYSQLIARRIREQRVYCELFPWNTSPTEVLKSNPKGFILSGGPLSIYQHGAPKLPEYVLDSKFPVLGICYGMQALAAALDGIVRPAQKHEYGQAQIDIKTSNPLITEDHQLVWMSHGDRIDRQPEGFQILASSPNSPIAAMGDINKNLYGLQFHPEVNHTPKGSAIICRFVLDICHCEANWTPASIIQQAVEQIRQQVGSASLLSAVSGGVDSSVATALAYQAVGNQLTTVFVDTGMLRLGERLQVEKAFSGLLGKKLITVNAIEEFMDKLYGVIDPEEKRRIIGETFIRIFEKTAYKCGSQRFLVQGTIYPDVVESRAPDRAQAQRIKTHHNVGGLPEDMQFELVEPLRYLFKDEVRAVGETLGLPKELIWRQPFPGPGLAVRCLGKITLARLETLRQCDAIFTQELAQADLLRWDVHFSNQEQGSSQAFAVLLPVRTVGVMGDQRTYQEVVALRAVTTDDFMTADWARLPNELLARVSNRIVNEVPGVNRVVYDITSKPPATIEWE